MRSNRVGWLLLAPTIAILGIFGIVPFLYVLYVAFHQWNRLGANPYMIYNGADTPPSRIRRRVPDVDRRHDEVAFFAVPSEVALGQLGSCS